MKGQGNNNSQRQDSLPTASRLTPEEEAMFAGAPPKVKGYNIISALGEGGFGIVYLAEQQKPVRRRVALKVIKPGMDSKRVIARFEAEEQALALLDHTNVAQIYEAGMTETGQSYFAMEYVKGVPITEYCDRERLSIEERLGLFIQVCDAIGHAHQKGIIHRDIKPSNILICLQDEKTIPKVIDFGVAKAISQPLTERTLFTEQGQLVGTPAYMSPEQAEVTAQDVDTRTDIYSLGVLLYELLTGVLPFDPKTLREVAFSKIQRIIREQDPPRPSTRLSSLGEEGKTVAQSRRTQVAALARRLHKELEWIPLKAMRKERSRRYRSASELADDIQNYLEGAPLIAGPESAVYRVKKFVRRNRALVTGVAAVLVVLVAGVVVSTIFAIGQSRARAQAEQARGKEAAARVQAEQAESIAQQQRRRAQHLLARSQIDRGVKLLNEGNCEGLLNLLEARMTAEKIPEVREQTGRLWAIAHDLWSDRLVHVLPPAVNLVFSPDRKLLATAESETAQLWDTATGQPHGQPLQLEKVIGAVVFSPDGKLLATHSAEGVSRLWDTATGQPMGPILRTESGPHVEWGYAKWSAAFSPDGKLLATASPGGTVRLWETDTGEPYGEPLRHEGEVWAVAFSPNGKLLASGSTDGTAQLWEVANGQPHGPALQHEGEVRKVVFSPDGKLIATMFWWTVGLWRMDTGQLHKWLRQPRSVEDIAFSPDGKLLAASSDWTVQLWDTTTGERHGEPLRHESPVWLVAFSPDGTLLATASTCRTRRLWDVASGEPYGLPLRGQEGIEGMAFSPDGKFLATGSWAGARIWRTYQPLNTRVVPQQRGVQLGTVSPDEKIGAIISGETVQLWDTTAVKTLGEPLHHDGRVRTVAFGPDGKLLAVGLPETIQMWDVATGQPFGPLLKTENLRALAFSPDGKLLAAGSAWEALVFEVATGRSLRTFDCNGEVWGVAFSQDGKVLATAVVDGTARLWDIASGQQLASPLRHQARVWAVAYSPDGSILATASEEEGRTVRLWDVTGGPPYHSLALPPQAISGKAALESFSSDGTLLVRRLPEGKARVWRLPAAPTHLREMQLRTWVALGAERNEQGEVEAISWREWQKLREELRSLLGEAERSDEYYVSIRLEPDRKEAEELMLTETLDIKRRVLGEEHPDTVITIDSLIELYEAWGKPDKAEQWRAKLPGRQGTEEKQ
ncbi:MAG: protein kinase domain-containing protein [Planctomycetota bacterium]|jgi:WD40 repeat protein/serine/threonine protein kinase